MSSPDSHEIERKFLVPELPAAAVQHPAEAIAQGYLARDGERQVEVRVRQKAGRHFLTVKVGGGQSRIEVELPLEPHDFAALWPATEGRRIAKTRRRLPIPDSADCTIELDVYEGALAGLCVAEVEFPDEAAAHAFQPPAWFGREVTDDPAYRNAALARDGLPPASHPALTHGRPVPPQ
jgi:adenylate cyclase